MMSPRISKRVEHSMSSSFAVKWLLDSRVTRISENRLDKSPLTSCFALSGLPVEVRRYCASTLTTYKPAVSIVFASITNSMTSTRCTVCLPWTLASAGFLQFCILLQASNAPSHTSQSRTFGCTCLLIYQRSRCQASTSSLQTQKGLVSPFSHGCPSCSTRPRIPKHAAVVCCSSSFARHFSVTLKMPPVGLHGHCHTLRSMVSSASVSSAVRRSARLTRSAAQLAADFHLLQLSQFLLGHLFDNPVDGNHTYPLRARGLKHPCVHWLWPSPCGARVRTLLPAYECPDRPQSPNNLHSMMPTCPVHVVCTSQVNERCDDT